MIRVLGIDPGSLCTGYGIIDSDQNKISHVANGTIRLAKYTLAEKLKHIQEQLMDLIDHYQPDEFCIERIFMCKNADSALKLGQARGVAIAACAMKGLEIAEYTANQIKKATVGRGHASKQQVQHMIKVLLCLRDLPPADAADALAVALCHSHVQQGKRRMQVANITPQRSLQ